MLAIRLARLGTNKKPFYRVLLLEKSSARNGRSLEMLGTYNPQPATPHLELNLERIQHWVARGAQMSERVAKLVGRAQAAKAAAAAPVA